MNAKEQAEKLHKKFMNIQIPYSDCISGTIEHSDMDWDSAKECALSTIEEILLSHYPDYELNKYQTYWHPYDFWNQVKQHLLTL